MRVLSWQPGNSQLNWQPSTANCQLRAGAINGRLYGRYKRTPYFSGLPMLPKTLSTGLVAWLFVFAASVAAAQTDQARLMGVVTDGSGGALPGVTVTISARNMRPTSF